MAKRIINKLKERAEQLGYSGLSDFMRRSGVKVSQETVRLAIYEGRPVTPASLVLVMKALEYTSSEIGEYLKGTGEKEFSELLLGVDTTTSSLPNWQKIGLKYLDLLRKENPIGYNQIVDMLAIVLKASDIEMDEKDQSLLKARG